MILNRTEGAVSANDHIEVGGIPQQETGLREAKANVVVPSIDLNRFPIISGSTGGRGVLSNSR